jgi:hypothetical protein
MFVRFLCDPAWEMRAAIITAFEPWSDQAIVRVLCANVQDIDAMVLLANDADHETIYNRVFTRLYSADVAVLSGVARQQIVDRCTRAIEECRDACYAPTQEEVRAARVAANYRADIHARDMY